MRNIRVMLEYDGSAFSGWQIQPKGRTVQGEIAAALYKLTGREVRVIGAGRTDAGVHAVGQVANFKLETGHATDEIREALNGNLPPDILVKNAEEVNPRFHARYDAYSKTYEYVMIKKRTALWKGRFLTVPGDLDADAMRTAAAKLRGERDFSSFASVSEAKTNRCRVISAVVSELPPLVTISVTADRFLYKMVRAIAGTLLEIGKGKEVDISEVLDSKDRSKAGPTLPPHALYLSEVNYDPPSA